MNTKIFSLTLCLLAMLFGMSSCDDSSEGLTRITYYPTIKLVGGAVTIQKGTEYVEPGYSSTLNGEDVTDKVVVSSNLDVNKSGAYTVTYTTMKNADGYQSTTTRTVYVLDLNDPIEGFYSVDPASFRTYDGKNVAYGSSYSILVTNAGDGSYAVDDILGGWYCQRAGYGTDYAMGAHVTIADDGAVSLVDSYIPGWGDSLTGFSGTYDAASATFNYQAVYVSGMSFNVTMSKQ